MKQLLALLVFVPLSAGCAFFPGRSIRISGEALSLKTDVPEHQHVQVDGQCLTCLRHTSDDLTDRVSALEIQLQRYHVFAAQNDRQMVEKLEARDDSSPAASGN